MLKQLLPILLCLSAAAQEIRYVNNVRVDLTPLKSWIESKSGERPLQHWKEIKITNIKPVNEVWQQCTIVVDKKTRTVLLKNIPKAAQETFAMKESLAAQIASLRRETQAEADRIERVAANAASISADAYGSWQSRLDHDRLNLRQAQKRLSALSTQHRLAGDRFNKLASELAMHTGQYGGLEVWDCGVKQR